MALGVNMKPEPLIFISIGKKQEMIPEVRLSILREEPEMERRLEGKNYIEAKSKKKI